MQTKEAGFWEMEGVDYVQSIIALTDFMAMSFEG